MSNYLKKDTMKRTYDDLDQELLEKTRDLMTSMGLNPLTDELIQIKENLFNVIHQYERIKDHTISKVSKDLRKSLTPEMKTKLKEIMKEKKWKTD
jgi:hypothetical protein